MEYAGFWKRLAASLIDGIILSIVARILGLEYTYGLLYTAITWLYFAGLESSSLQATPGKLALGIKVTNGTGGRLSFARATGRHFAKIVSAIILFIGYLMALWTERKQALHDIIADCLVVNSR